MREKTILFFIVASIWCKITLGLVHPIPQTLQGRLSDDSGSSESSSEEFIDGRVAPNGLRVSSFEPNLLDLISPSSRYNGDLQKRVKNFLRYGRSDEYEIPALRHIEDLSEESKRNTKNFLRFGRLAQKHLMKLANALRYGDSSSMEDSDEALYRTNKASDRNFIRFGRSINSDSEIQNNQQNPEFPTEKSSSPVEKVLSSRSKRSAPIFYDDLDSLPMWTQKYLRSLAQISPASLEKRGQHPMNFYRYGREPLDLHFLRYGKRSSEELTPDKTQDRAQRASDLNFIRYG